MKHLINTKDFDLKTIENILDKAKLFKHEGASNLLQDKLIITIFFENSTRTRSSFEVAAKRLGANVVSLDVSKSSSSKGETLFDTAANLDAMEPNAIVVRHKNAGVPKILSNYVNCPIVNGGDGSHAHPTQALLDLFTIKEHFGELKDKKIAIVGDIKNSRVANSNIELLSRFGLEVIMVAPPHFMPQTTHFRQTHEIKEVIDEVDIIMSLRTQTERHSNQIYASLKDYATDFCITKKLVEDRDILLLHPGPVHRNIDIDDEMLSDPRCKVLEQVKNGVFTRMAVLNHLISGVNDQS
ncbi:MAG: aspartate carbamoyltransferase catalytic subunit [Epsilonproteobacteria bacterium]|nr:aspartate carbamoyltransferase catalytic subunit [Campylobacterota bacterium]